MKEKKFKEESLGTITDSEKIKKLEALLQTSKTNPFGTEDEIVFKKQMEEMSTTDLQNLCRKVSLVPRTSREKLKEQLLQEFRSVSRSSNILQFQSAKNPNHSDKLLSLIKD